MLIRDFYLTYLAYDYVQISYECKYLPTVLYAIDLKASTSDSNSARRKCTTWLSRILLPKALRSRVYSIVCSMHLSNGISTALGQTPVLMMY